jgi:hypothetical protein
MARADRASSPGHLYADGHVHLYTEYDQARFFHNTLRVACSFRAPLLLLLVEAEGQSYFTLLRDHIAARPQAAAPASSVQLDVAAVEGLELAITGEPSSLTITSRGSNNPAVFLIAGRQFVSKENLEVLIVGLDPEDELCSTRRGDRSAEDLIERALRSSAIAILPWGFGKWIGSRGRLVAQLAHRARFGQEPLFFLGDTPARCWPWSTPESFHGSARVLPGTDVLPLPGFENRLASYGFRLQGHFDPEVPFGSLAELLRQRVPLEPFGRRDSLIRAILAQVRLRLHRSDSPHDRSAPAAR